MFCFTLDIFQVSSFPSLSLTEVFDYFVGRSVSDSLVVSIKKSTDISFLFACFCLHLFFNSTSSTTITCLIVAIHRFRTALSSSKPGSKPSTLRWRRKSADITLTTPPLWWFSCSFDEWSRCTTSSGVTTNCCTASSIAPWPRKSICSAFWTPFESLSWGPFI